MSAKTPVKGHASKHVHKASKHHKAKGKHHQAHVTNPVPQFRVVPPHAVGKPAGHPKPRGFAAGDLLPVCAFEAAAMWLRLEGVRVTGDDVAMRWETLGEVSIPDAARAFGLTLEARRDLNPHPRIARRSPVELPASPLILGVDFPGPHAVLATADGWWSWGKLYDPWPCRIEEAWAVSWS